MNSSDVMLSGFGIVAGGGVPLPNIPESIISRVSSDADIKALIGKRGIRYKDRATRMALVASRIAMSEAGILEDYAKLDDERFGVVGASCFGNLGITIDAARQIASSGSTALSPMNLPNASANVMPATLAIWFGLRATNLLMANGISSSFDAVAFAVNLINANRADRMLVCASETQVQIAADLFEGRDNATQPPVDVSIAMILERSSNLDQKTQKIEVPFLRRDTDQRLVVHSAYRGSSQIEELPLLPFAHLHGAAGLAALAQFVLEESEIHSTGLPNRNDLHQSPQTSSPGKS